jgi:hypothetical protein
LTTVGLELPVDLVQSLLHGVPGHDFLEELELGITLGGVREIRDCCIASKAM